MNPFFAKSDTSIAGSSYLQATLANAVIFALICGALFWIVSGSAAGLSSGVTYGALYGMLFSLASRAAYRQMGDTFAGLFVNGFSGTVSGAFAALFTKFIQGSFLLEFIHQVFGEITGGMSQLAFYVIAEGAFFGGGLGVAQSLLFGRLKKHNEQEPNKAPHELPDKQEKALKESPRIHSKEKQTENDYR